MEAQAKAILAVLAFLLLGCIFFQTDPQTGAGKTNLSAQSDLSKGIISKAAFKNITSEKTALYAYRAKDEKGGTLFNDRYGNRINAATNTFTSGMDLFDGIISVPITPSKALLTDKDFIKAYCTDPSITFGEPFYYDIKEVEKTKPTYAEVVSESCHSSISNSTGQNTTVCQNVTSQVQTGTETYLENETFKNYDYSLIEKPVEIQLPMHRPSMNTVADCWYSIAGQERKDAAWWNANCTAKFQINSTGFTCSNSACQINMSVALNTSLGNGSTLHIVDSSETTELGIWREDGFNYTSALGTLWVNASNATSMMYGYYCSGLADPSNVGIFAVGDTFTNTTLNATRWTYEHSGTGTTTIYGGAIYFNPSSTNGHYEKITLANNLSLSKWTARMGVKQLIMGDYRLHLTNAPTSPFEYSDSALSMSNWSGSQNNRVALQVATAALQPRTPEIWEITFDNSTGNYSDARMILANGSTVNVTKQYAKNSAATNRFKIFSQSGGAVGTAGNQSVEFVIVYPSITGTPTFTFGAQQSAPATTGNLTVNATAGGSVWNGTAYVQNFTNSSFTPPMNFTINVSVDAGYSFVGANALSGNCSVLSNASDSFGLEVLDTTACSVQADFGKYGNLTVNGTTGIASVSGSNDSFIPPQNLTINFTLSPGYRPLGCTITEGNATVMSNGSTGCIVQVFDSTRANVQANAETICRTLSTTGATETLDQNLSSSGTCFTVAAENVTIDCEGYSISGSGAGMAISSDRNGTRVLNCNIDNYETGVSMTGLTNGLVSASNITTVGQGVYLANAEAILTGNYINASVAFPGVAVYIFASEDTLFEIWNSTLIGSEGATIDLFAHASGGTIANNTLMNSQSTAHLLVARATSADNLIYWNNFTEQGGAGYYVYDLNGSNFYNTTISGHGEGNIYENVINGSVSVYGNVSAPFAGLYYGLTGAGYPYNNSTAAGKLAGAVVDYAPLTSKLLNYSCSILNNGSIRYRVVFSIGQTTASYVYPTNQTNSSPIMSCFNYGAAISFKVSQNETYPRVDTIASKDVFNASNVNLTTTPQAFSEMVAEGGNFSVWLYRNYTNLNNMTFKDVGVEVSHSTGD